MWPAGGVSEDRRKAKRYLIERKIVIRTAKKSGVGKTLNISSGGLLVTTSINLIEGSWVELAVDWPVELNGECKLNFLISGNVVRTRETTAAIRIRRYQFRTRGQGQFTQSSRQCASS
jgi:hypothetical protein